jgi:hypothetical protein
MSQYNKSKRKDVWIMSLRNVFISCLFFCVFSAFSQDMPPGEPPLGKMSVFPHGASSGPMHDASGNPQPMMMNIAEVVNLLNEINIEKSTSSKIVSIARGFLAFFEAKVLKIQKEEIAVKEELLKEKPDMQAIQNAVTKKSQLFSEIEFAQIKRDVEIKSLLTQDEYDRWKSAMMKKMRQLMPKMMDKGPQNAPDKKAPPRSGPSGMN